MHNTPKNSGTSFLLGSDGGIVDMPVSDQKWGLTESEAPTLRNLARKCAGSSYTLPYLTGSTDPDNYASYLSEKCAHILDLFKAHGFKHPAPHIFASEPERYRMRAEFAVFFTGERSNPSFEYVMYQKKNGEKERLFIKDFTPGAAPISRLLNPLRRLLLKNEALCAKLFEIDFLVSLKEEAVIVLHYHRRLEESSFALELEELRSDLLEQGFNVPGICAHARKQLITAGDPFIIEELPLEDGRTIKLKQVEGTFSQPNAGVCRKMLDFAVSASAGQKNSDLLELYCGSGTFTCALAPSFRRVLATEICRVPTKTAFFNLQNNGITNTKLVRLSAVEVSEALNKVRPFRRLEEAQVNLDDYRFSTLLIDPPRSGLCDQEALAFTAQFERVIYISCGMDSLVTDLDFLTQSHDIKELAFFDQFPYTPHLESGVLLTRKNCHA